LISRRDGGKIVKTGKIKKMSKNIFPKAIITAALAICFVAGTNFSRAEGNGIFLTLHAKKETKNPDVALKGRVGKDASVSISVNDEDIGPVSLDEHNKYRVRVPLTIGGNTIRVAASFGNKEKIIEKNIERKAKTAQEKPLWISIVHTKNRIKKSDVAVRGEARGVSEVRISVDGVFQGTALVSAKKGKFKLRVSLAPGVNIIEARAESGGENITATKRVKKE
jgi:hypothetical protein